MNGQVYVGQFFEQALIDSVVERAVDDGVRTRDIAATAAPSVSRPAMGDAVTRELERPAREV